MADGESGFGGGEPEYRGGFGDGSCPARRQRACQARLRSASVSPGRSDMGVSMGPGLMALMRMPSAMYSRAAARVRALTAALVAA